MHVCFSVTAISGTMTSFRSYSLANKSRPSSCSCTAKVYFLHLSQKGARRKDNSNPPKQERKSSEEEEIMADRCLIRVLEKHLSNAICRVCNRIAFCNNLNPIWHVFDGEVLRLKSLWGFPLQTQSHVLQTELLKSDNSSKTRIGLTISKFFSRSNCILEHEELRKLSAHQLGFGGSGDRVVFSFV